MSMQEFEQEGQEKPEPGAYQANYTESYEAERQKIHPYAGQRQGSAMHIVAIVLSSIGFAFSVVGVVGSSIVLHVAQSAGGPPELIAGGVLGLVASILTMLIFIAIFVVAIVLLAVRAVLRRSTGGISSRRRSLGNLGNPGW